MIITGTTEPGHTIHHKNSTDKPLISGVICWADLYYSQTKFGGITSAGGKLTPINQLAPKLLQILDCCDSSDRECLPGLY